MPLPMRYAGTMMPYDFSNVQTAPVWPDSLRPVYLAHVARHGARYITSERKLTYLRKVIGEANDGGTLTDTGRNFSILLDSVSSPSEGRWGALSGVGEMEEVRIAQNLSKLLPTLMNRFKAHSISSYVPRVVMTMYEFCCVWKGVSLIIPT